MNENSIVLLKKKLYFHYEFILFKICLYSSINFNKSSYFYDIEIQYIPYYKVSNNQSKHHLLHEPTKNLNILYDVAYDIFFLENMSKKNETHSTFIISEISLIKSFHFFLLFFTIIYNLHTELFSLFLYYRLSFSKKFLITASFFFLFLLPFI